MVIFFQLFLQFDGPSNIILQTRGPRLNDILSARQVNEIADSPRGTIAEREQEAENKKTEEAVNPPTRPVEQIEQDVKGVDQNVATVTNSGDVQIGKDGLKSAAS